MATQAEIDEQQKLLATHRKTLAILLQQKAKHTSIYVPPATEHGIDEARQDIQKIKMILRSWDIVVEDHPEDEEIQSVETIKAPVSLESNGLGEVGVTLQRPNIISPFHYWGPIPSVYFYGRNKQRAEIREKMQNQPASCISVTGKRTIGKTSLLFYIRDYIKEFCNSDEKPICIVVYGMMYGSQFLVSINEQLRRDLFDATDLNLWSHEDNKNLLAVASGLKKLRDNGYRLIMVVEEIEAIFHDLEDMIALGEFWQSIIIQELCTIIISSWIPLNDLYNYSNIVSPFTDVFNVTVLGAMEDPEWRSLVKDGFNSTGVSLNNSDMSLIYELAGGLPFFTQLAADILLKYSDHEKTRKIFADQAYSNFVYLWSVKELERHALRYAAGLPRLRTPREEIYVGLQRHGLIRPDGLLFSSAFADFVRSRD